MTTSTGKFVGYNITELEQIALFELGQVSGTTVSYSRFPRWLIRQKLTERQNLFAAMTQCLKKLALIPAQDGRRTYRLPINCMDGGVISAKYYTSASDYDELDIRDTRWLDEHRQGWRTEGEADPEIAFMGSSYGNTQTISVHPVPDTDGESYADNLDTGVYLGSSCPGTGTNITGTATSTGDSTTLNDTAKTFTAEGLVAGMAVRDLTDGSYGKLLTINATSLILSDALTGGENNIFTSGDSYIVLAGEYAVVTSVTQGDRYIFASEIGMLENLTIPADTILIEYVPYPSAFPFDPSATDANQGWLTMYPEIPRDYHYALAMGAVADMLRTFNENTKEFNRAEAYEARFNEAVALGKINKAGRPFEDSHPSFVPARKRR